MYRSLTKLPFVYVSKWCKPKSIRFLVPCSSGFWTFPNHTHFCHNQWPPCRVLGSTAISGGLCLLFRHFWWPPMKNKGSWSLQVISRTGMNFSRCFVITLNMVGSYPLNGYIHDTKVECIQPKHKFGASYIMSLILGCHQLTSKRIAKVTSWYVL